MKPSLVIVSHLKPASNLIESEQRGVGISVHLFFTQLLSFSDFYWLW
ncbi:hypothetical protein KL86DYS2_13033 [uncultured Dysgonomonas sp.]|uniref:Uncharacterized protein n=1 Tax=uncultured Dysgonomonas sp. TaxID=206096 RepID=A0A212K4W2_9BACT|nr:hypothetical protein KL86DYS2_13033 [uncultured Dysgonomonas sp.]